MVKPQEKEKGWLGTLSLILGIVALILSWVPFLGFVLSLMAIVVSGYGFQKIKTNKGLVITGLVFGILGLITAIFVSIFAGGLILLGTQLEKDTTPIIEGEEQAGEVPSELILKVGETAKTPTLEVTVLSVEKTSFYPYTDIFGGTSYHKANSGNKFLLTDIRIKNIGSERLYVGSTEFSATDSEGNRYDTEILSYYGNDGLDIFQELYQNQKMEGKILFEVKEDAEELEIIYDFGDIFTGTSLVKWKVA